MAVSVLAGFGVYEMIGFITAECEKEREANPDMDLNCSFTKTQGFEIAFIAYPTGRTRSEIRKGVFPEKK